MAYCLKICLKKYIPYFGAQNRQTEYIVMVSMEGSFKIVIF